MHRISRRVPSCTDEALNVETCMSADCTIALLHFGVVEHSVELIGCPFAIMQSSLPSRLFQHSGPITLCACLDTKERLRLKKLIKRYILNTKMNKLIYYCWANSYMTIIKTFPVCQQHPYPKVFTLSLFTMVFIKKHKF